MRDRAFLILFLAVVPGVLAAVGATTFGDAGDPVKEFSVYMKRFGLAAVLPLAMNCYASPRLYRWSPIMLFVCILAMDLFSIFPDLRSILLIASLEADPSALGERAMGLISNPNDSAYIAICAMAGVIATITLRKRPGFWMTLLMGSAVAGSLVNVVLSGSRSGLIALLAGLFYYILVSRSSSVRKSLIIGLFALSGCVGLSYSSEFKQRMESALTQQLGEESVESRLQAQYVALLATLKHPLGVGFLNFPQATARLSGGMVFAAVEGSDSVYFDTLLGAGFLGLAALLLLYSTCWKYLRTSLHRPTEASLILRAGCIAISVFGLATTSPFSVFVSPVAFFMVGSCAFREIGRGRPISVSRKSR